ncbi:MAG: HAD-IIA family hydrolase [Chloroflexi bacterium]|nr:HAD-IIA family hydrolase [Chloroflexota bacterium]MBM4466462.1 HAD-IIA family hydrolase [Chloroflexota bacterium]
MLHGIRGVIFDIDGVLEYQGQVYPGAIDAIETLRQKGFVLRFLTNSTLHSRQSRTANLIAMGFHVFAGEVITASYATARYLRHRNPRSCWVMLEGEGLDEFSAFRQDMENPEYIVVGDNRSKFDFDHLNHALRLLLKGAKLVGTNPDLVDNSRGATELNVGAWVRLLEVASGVRAAYVGKPQPFVFELALTDMGLDKDQVVMVGDRIQSDIRGAQAFGIRSVLVKTGEFQVGDLDADIKPDFILDSITDLVGLLTKNTVKRSQQPGAWRNG